MSESDCESDSAKENNEEVNFEVIIRDNEEDKDKNNKPKIQKRKIGKGSDYLHILPANFINKNDAFISPVDTYFETQIKEIKKDNQSNNDYQTFLRGRLLNGKKCNISEINSKKNDQDKKISFDYYEITKENKKNNNNINDNNNNSNEYTVNNCQNINEYFLWKFDEKILSNEPMTNINELLEKFDCLA